MTAAALVRAAREMLSGVPSVELQESHGDVVGVVVGEPTVIVRRRGSGVEILLRNWLEARPRRPSPKLAHIDVDEPGWEGIYTESEWHVRGVLSRAGARIASRTSVSQRLHAHLLGRANQVALTPDRADYWKAVAKWGKATGRIGPSDRRFAWLYAERLERNLQVSPEFAGWARRKSIELRALGFEPPLRDAN